MPCQQVVAIGMAAASGKRTAGRPPQQKETPQFSGLTFTSNGQWLGSGFDDRAVIHVEVGGPPLPFGGGPPPTLRAIKAYGIFILKMFKNKLKPRFGSKITAPFQNGF